VVPERGELAFLLSHRIVESHLSLLLLSPYREIRYVRLDFTMNTEN
jgi:hypothetical protein